MIHTSVLAQQKLPYAGPSKPTRCPDNWAIHRLHQIFSSSLRNPHIGESFIPERSSLEFSRLYTIVIYTLKLFDEIVIWRLLNILILCSKNDFCITHYPYNKCTNPSVKLGQISYLHILINFCNPSQSYIFQTKSSLILRYKLPFVFRREDSMQSLNRKIYNNFF